MSGHTDNLNDDEAPLAPAALAALRELHTPTIAVPRHRDARVLADAQRTLARRRFFATGMLAHRGVRAALALAAMVLITAGVQMMLSGRTGHSSRQGARVATDIDADGHVDIVDAMVLAAEVRRGRGRDVNGDGVIDQSDVDALAQVAVRLDRGGA